MSMVDLWVSVVMLLGASRGVRLRSKHACTGLHAASPVYG